MGLMTLARAHYFNKVRPQGNERSTVRQIILPDQVTAVGLQLVADAAGLTYGAWGDIALPAAVTTDTIVVGIVLDTPTAAEIYTIDIGSTYIPQVGINYANAAAVIAAVVAGTITNIQVHRCEVRAEVAVFAATGPNVTIMLPFPVWFTSGQGILGRVYSVGAVANQIGASVLCVQGFK
jgi:hypothetical protein